MKLLDTVLMHRRTYLSHLSAANLTQFLGKTLQSIAVTYFVGVFRSRRERDITRN